MWKNSKAQLCNCGYAFNFFLCFSGDNLWGSALGFMWSVHGSVHLLSSERVELKYEIAFPSIYIFLCVYFYFCIYILFMCLLFTCSFNSTFNPGMLTRRKGCKALIFSSSSSSSELLLLLFHRENADSHHCYISPFISHFIRRCCTTSGLFNALVSRRISPAGVRDTGFRSPGQETTNIYALSNPIS